jgi:hypothetical protein
VREYIREHRVDVDGLHGKNVAAAELGEAIPFDEATPQQFLYQAGYLTLRESNGVFRLEYPNAEVHSSLSRLFTDNMFRSPDAAEQARVRLKAALMSGDVPRIVGEFRLLFGIIVYDDHSARDRKLNAVMAKVKDEQHSDAGFPAEMLTSLGEGFYRSSLQSFLRGIGADAVAEFHTSHGRIDLKLTDGLRTYVIETKTSRDASGVSAKAREGFEQILETGYSKSFHNPILMSIAINEAERDIGFCLYQKEGKIGTLDFTVPGTPDVKNP